MPKRKPATDARIAAIMAKNRENTRVADDEQTARRQRELDDRCAERNRMESR